MQEVNDCEYSIKEISQVLNISENSCRQTLLVALKKLKHSTLEEYIGDKIMSDHIKKYLRKKYGGRYTLKIEQAAKEMLTTRRHIKDLRDSGILPTLSIKNIANYIVNNPPQKR